MSRNGKIARLPGQIREEIDRRLYDGEDGKKILGWLNSVDEVKAILAEKFDGRPITKGNLCEWRQGGHRDWEMHQATLAETHRVVSEGLELDKVGEKALADKLAVWLVGRYVVVTRQLIENQNDPAAWKLLRELCHDVVALRRGDHGAEWLRIEREKLKLQRKKQQSDREKLKQEILKENPPPEVLSDEEKERRWNQIFGISPDTQPMNGMRRWDQAPDSAATPAPSPEAPINPIPPIASISPISPPVDPEILELQQVTELAEKGHAYSAYCLGARYRDGCGVPKDLAKAREWLGKAAAQGIGSAKIDLHCLLMKHDDGDLKAEILLPAFGQLPDTMAVI
jgi:hypothetical protein